MHDALPFGSRLTKRIRGHELSVEVGEVVVGFRFVGFAFQSRKRTKGSEVRSVFLHVVFGSKRRWQQLRVSCVERRRMGQFDVVFAVSFVANVFFPSSLDLTTAASSSSLRIETQLRR